MKRFTAMMLIGSLALAATVLAGGEEAPKPADSTVALDPSSLSKALDSPSKLVRYHAAATLASVQNTRRFENVEKVVPLLRDALSERAGKVAFVAVQDPQVAKLFHAALYSRGYLVDVATDEVVATNMAFTGLIKDVLFVDASMKQVLKVFLNDHRTSGQPLVLIADEGEARDARVALKDHVTGYILKPLTPDTIGGALDDVLKHVPDPPGKSLADSFNLLAAQALAGMDLRSGYPVAQATDALIGALELRDEVKLPSMACLGRLGALKAVPELMDVANSMDQSEAARLGAIDAIDQISRKNGAIGDDAKEMLEDLLQDELKSVRHAAAVALGANSPTDSALDRLIDDPGDIEGPAFGE